MEQALERPVPLHRRTHPDLNAPGCFGCKAAGVRFGGIHSMKKMREDGSTGQSIKQEIYDAARRTGRDITRAR